MQIKHYFQPVVASGLDGTVEEWQLSLHVWVSRERVQSPVANWDSDMIEAGLSNLFEIVVLNPGTPMLRQLLGCRILS